MNQVAGIVTGPVVLAVAALALGRLMLRGLGFRLYRGEEWALGFVTGAAGLSLLVTLAGAAGQARKGVFVGTTAALAVAALWRTRRGAMKRLPPLAPAWGVFFAVVFAGYLALYFVNALTPETAGGERLGLAFREWRTHRLAGWPDGMRMLFLFAFSFGRHSSAALAHLAFLVALPLTMLCYARRFGFGGSGAFAALAVLAAPAAGAVGTRALDDVALAAVLFALFYVAQLRHEVPARGVAVVGALLAAFALSLRYRVPEVVVLRGPRELALWGTPAGSLLGPVFLLAPLALLALRYPQRRRFVAAAAILGAAGAAGGEARWLIPCLPFTALAMGLAVRNSPGAAPALAVVAALSGWPGVMHLYTAGDAWRLRGFPVAAALRQEPEDQYLNARVPGYALARLVDQFVPERGRTFAFGEVAAAYTTREVVTGGVPGMALEAALDPRRQPGRRIVFRFAARTVRGLRVRGGKAVAEFRVLAGAREVARAPGWRLRAGPDVRAAALAFDNSYVTRWEGAGPGAYLEIDFPAPVKADGIMLEGPREQDTAALVWEGREESGWKALAGAATVEDGVVHGHLREAAVEELKARGIGYVLVRDADAGTEDFRRMSLLWGLAPAVELYDARLYRVE